MISSSDGYVIVDSADLILIYTLSSSRKKAWAALAVSEKMRKHWKSVGFKCVRATIQTEEYKR
jgi:hypothetical protein